mgnify:CR=1 FL=1
MALEPSDVLLESVFCQLDADTPRSLHDLKGDPRANLLAIRLLFRQGRITGVLLDWAHNGMTADPEPAVTMLEKLLSSDTVHQILSTQPKSHSASSF